MRGCSVNSKCGKYYRIYRSEQIFLVGCIWKVIRKTGSIPCCNTTNPTVLVYSKDNAIPKSIALSYLVYGCETSDGLSCISGEWLHNGYTMCIFVYYA